ncbi:hypothetical protein B0H13DRAFT_2034884 [Mycena leptocephala]|nr:hypothetical protein B0H13DRAFT_2034884 [Mycena leptocephala]
MHQQRRAQTDASLGAPKHTNPPPSSPPSKSTKNRNGSLLYPRQRHSILLAAPAAHPPPPRPRRSPPRPADSSNHPRTSPSPRASAFAWSSRGCASAVIGTAGGRSKTPSTTPAFVAGSSASGCMIVPVFTCRPSMALLPHYPYHPINPATSYSGGTD